MPIICEFLGVQVCMYFKEHNPPHIHVRCSGKMASINIETCEIMHGDIAKNRAKLVLEFVHCYQDQLMDMWIKKEIRKINYDI
ncbi:MAG: DUF4160 domain-containing protein [Bacilli bacterium]|nr:DUF4160 domain-containing protein [Bacilli bacterium]